MPRNFDETVRLQSEKREEWIREVRERLQKIAESRSSAPRLDSSSAASFPGRNKCLGTHCSLIVHEEKDSSYQICQRICGKRKDGGGDRARFGEEKWQTLLPTPAKSLRNGAGFSGKTCLSRAIEIFHSISTLIYFLKLRQLAVSLE